MRSDIISMMATFFRMLIMGQWWVRFTIVAMVSVAAVAAPPLWQFPRDYGAHPEFNTEWWYITGHLVSDTHELFGFQLTFFRYKLTPVHDGKSPFNAPHLYTAHVALTRSASNQFVFDDTHARDMFGQIEAPLNGLTMIVNQWSLQYQGGRFSFDIPSRHGRLSLELQPSKPIVFHGDQGLSYKSSTKTHFSYYYSHTRLTGRGTWQTPSETIRFKRASAWMDRELFDRLLAEDQTGWYWFALQLDSNEELMIFQVNGMDGTYQSGTFISQNGAVQSIDQSAIDIDILERWTSPVSGYTYPTKWRLTITLDSDQAPRSYLVNAVMKNQELSIQYPFSIHYWEGQMRVSGDETGLGYVEIVPQINRASSQ